MGTFLAIIFFGFILASLLVAANRDEQYRGLYVVSAVFIFLTLFAIVMRIYLPSTHPSKTPITPKMVIKSEEVDGKVVVSDTTYVYTFN